MAKANKAKPKIETTSPVRIDIEIVNLVRANKSVSGVPVGKFFELAAIEKLKKQKK